MGKKDLSQIDYFGNKERFADLFNGVIFDGKEIIKSETLEEADARGIYRENEEKTVNVISDKVYKWKGQYFSILILENQSYVDYRMIFRVMLEETLSYLEQQKRAYGRWKKKGYKFSKDEYLSRMRKEEKYQPVITLVLYLGKEKSWDGAKCLYDMLELDDELKAYINNYKLNIYDYHEEKDFEKFKTENKLVFELLSQGKNKEGMEKVIKESKNQGLVDKETVQVICEMLDIKLDYEKIKIKTTEGREKYDMCQAWEEQKECGRIEGKKETRKEDLVALVNILSTLLPDFESVYEKIKSEKNYEDITREEVINCYYVN